MLDRLISIDKKAIAVALHLTESPLEEAQHSLEELKALTASLQYQITRDLIQSRTQPDSAFFLGRGKVQEIKEILEVDEVSLVVIDAELSAKQARNLEKNLGCVVWDRTQVILEIFAQNAKTREAKLQIELAQFQYMLPRLVGMWQHLDRERGGIGTSRGTGEKQIESDRKWIRQRISRLKQELKQVVQERHTQKQRRSHCLKVGLVGYTNAGKSSVMNALTNSELLVENKLFATLDATTRVFDSETKPRILLSDTVGFIKNLPHELVASFQSTLEFVKDADLLLHVVDISSDYPEHLKVTLQTLDEIGANRIPILLVFNKTDLIPSMQQMMIRKRHPEAIFISAWKGEVEELKQKVIHFFEQKMSTTHICLDYQHSHYLGSIYQWVRVDHLDYQEDGIYVTVTAPPAHIERLRNQIGETYFIGEHT